jgi:hypothetical protein
MGCEYCKNYISENSRGKHEYLEQTILGVSVHRFCSAFCLNQYKVNIVYKKELANQKKIEEEELKKNKREIEKEKEREESRALAQKTRDEFKKDMVDAAVLIKNSYQKQTKNVSCLKQLWSILIIILIICFLLSKIFHIDVRDLI